MLWIPIFVILFVGASIAISTVDSRNETMVRREYERKVRERNSEIMYAKRNYKDVPEPLEPKSDKQIRKEARERTTKLRFIVYGAVCGVVLLVTVLSSFYITNDQQVGFTMTFGKPTVIEGPGLHFKAPFITKVYKFVHCKF